MKLELIKLKKRFGSRVLFTQLSAQVVPGSPLMLAGPNGSGKSTLVKIICGLMGPDAGSVQLVLNGRVLPATETRLNIGLASPEIGLYDTLTAREHLLFFARLKDGLSQVDKLLDRCQLADCANMPVGKFSSGMRQRLKVALALMGNPPLIVLDEPTANLDEAGKVLIRQVISDFQQQGLVVLASNEPEEVSLFGKNLITLA